MLALPVSAQDSPAQNKELEDSVFTFRFKSKKDNRLFAPGMNNGAELAKLFDCVDQQKQLINDHKISLLVYGFCNLKGEEAKKIVKIRSNRVKSELITRRGLKESNFITQNRIAWGGVGDSVIVRFKINSDSIQATPQIPKIKENKPEAERPAIEIDSINNTQSNDTIYTQSESVQPDYAQPEMNDNIQQPVVVDKHSNSFWSKLHDKVALKTNLLGYGVLMPNIEIEWMVTKRWSVLFEDQGAWYAKESPHKVYRITTWIPEVRYWAIEHSRWHGMYVGIFGGAGIFDLCNGKDGKKGHEGEGGMIGVSAGYMWPISKHLSFDAGIGIGYLRIRDKEYLPLDGHFLYQLTKKINYFGPLRLKFSLVWRL